MAAPNNAGSQTASVFQTPAAVFTPSTAKPFLTPQNALVNGLPAFSIGGSSSSPIFPVTTISGAFVVSAVATSNVALSGFSFIDGLPVQTGWYVLLTAQTASQQNGPWLVNVSGAWTRPTWYQSLNVLQAQYGTTFFAQNGSVNAGSTWSINSPAAGSPITIDVTAVTFTQSFFNIASPHISGILAATHLPAFSGDLSSVGATASVTVTGINGSPLGVTTPTTGNVLIGNGSQWVSRAISGSGTLSSTGVLTVTGAPPTGTAGGDLNGTYPNPMVSAWNGVPLLTTTATAGNLMIGQGVTGWTSNPVTGDWSITSGGVATVVAINGVTLGVTTAVAGNVLIGQGSIWATKAISGAITLANTGITSLGANVAANSNLAQATAYTVKCNPTNATANETDASVGTFQQNFAGASVTADGLFGATGTVNFNGTPPSYLHTCTLTSATSCTLTFTAPPVSGILVGVEITQPAAGTATSITWPGSVQWQGTALQPAMVLGQSTVFFFYYDGTSYYNIYAFPQIATSSGIATFSTFTNSNANGRGLINVNGAELVGCGSGSAALAGANSANLVAVNSGALGFVIGTTLVGQVDTNKWARGFQGVGGNTEFANGLFGATGNISWLANGQYQSFQTTTLTACTISYTTNPPCPCIMVLKILAPAAGTSPAVTLPGRGTTSVTPTLAKDTVMFIYYDGSTYWNQAAVPNA